MSDKIFYAKNGLPVKTLFLKSLARDLTEDELFDYFSTFGPLQRLRIHVDGNHSFGLVKFEDDEAAATALQMNRHMIDGRIVEIEVAHGTIQDEPSTHYELQRETTICNGTEFMDLNDDCLRKILSNVSVMGLCSLLETSKATKNLRLRDLTNETYSRKFKSCLSISTKSASSVERILANFGPLIFSLSTDGISDYDTDSARKIRSIIRYCSGTLIMLTLKNYKFSAYQTHAMKPFFSTLARLVIESCHFEGDVADLFASCQSLISLRVSEYMPNKETIFQQTFASLSSIACSDFSNKRGYYNWGNFISRHRTLTSITILSCQDHSAMLPIIAENCPRLIYLAISTHGNSDPDQYESSVKSIAALKNLQTVLLRGEKNPLEFIRELNHLQSLRHLSLIHIRFDPEVLAALLELKMLETLSIRMCQQFTNFSALTELSRLKELSISSDEVNTIDVVYMASCLTALEKLIVKLKDFSIDKEMQSRIVDARAKSGSTKPTPLRVLCIEPKTKLV